MRVAPHICISGLLCLLASVQPIRAMAEVWLPVTPDELHLTSIAQAPGAAAVILYRQVDRNDSSNYEDVTFASRYSPTRGASTPTSRSPTSTITRVCAV